MLHEPEMSLLIFFTVQLAVANCLVPNCVQSITVQEADLRQSSVVHSMAASAHFVAPFLTQTKKVNCVSCKDLDLGSVSCKDLDIRIQM